MEFICLFCPAFISLLKENKRKNILKDKNYPEIICNYFLNNLIINCTILLITKILFNIYSYVFTVSFAIKYLLLACVIAYFLPDFIEMFNTKIIANIKRKQLIVKIIGFIRRHNKIFVAAFLFLLFFMLDYYCRTKCLEITSFYKIISVSPNILTAAYCLLIAVVIASLPKTISRISLTIIYLFHILLFLVNYFMLAIKKEAFTIYEITNANEGFQYLNCLIKELNISLVLVIIVSLFLFVISFLLLKENKKLKKKNKIIIIITIILFIILKVIGVCTLGKYDPNDWDCYNKPKFYYDNFTNPKRSLSVLGLYEYTARDFYLYLKDLTKVGKEKKEIEEIIDSKNYELEANEYTGIFKDKNLIMIMLESMDNLVISKETTPTLYKMREKGIDFTRRYGQLSNGGVTLATEFTAITGLYYSGRNYNIQKNKYSNSIPSTFANYGYDVSYIHENSGVYYNRSVLMKAMGFPNSYFLYDYLDDADHNNDIQLSENDDVYNKIVNDKKGKFMTFITTIIGHGPYVNNIPCSADAVAMQSELACFKYLANNTDEFLKILMDRLKEDKLLDDTVIVLFTDHYAYTYSYTEEELKNTYPRVDKKYNIKNLPFIIYSSNIKHKEINNILVNDVDILPTLFNMFGIEYNPNEYVGTDVFAKYHRNLVMFTDYSWYDGKIYSFDHKSKNKTAEFKEKNKYVLDTFKLNEMIINNNYYSSNKVNKQKQE